MAARKNIEQSVTRELRPLGNLVELHEKADMDRVFLNQIIQEDAEELQIIDFDEQKIRKSDLGGKLERFLEVEEKRL